MYYHITYENQPVPERDSEALPTEVSCTVIKTNKKIDGLKTHLKKVVFSKQ